ncbi:MULTISPECIES: homoserine kinase [unclassified Bacillus (in: firmicutes)]|uniref:homoserine kinase n=1 Tax=unclassified Bacillus (in: firmicutes) TaxID=185979 RepID=UPI0008ED2CD9|nr:MULTISPECIES: homoserine kinase [unclassified Bacillus (in: firmicutes)]SFB12729.1 homoserine kinase [Bacillus sp. UNCCL13]SFQ90211.1 homoserine kinase [Bacillus sp. cl95]
MSLNNFIIRVPGSTANLGPGFDSMGLAVDLFLTIEVEKSNKWEVIPLGDPDDEKEYPCDESNLICKTAIGIAERFNKSIEPCRLTIKSDIPLARGLGSSGAAIVAGIELVNVLACLDLSDAEKLNLATDLEGHPDNVGASIFGGLFVGSRHDKIVSGLSFKDLPFELIAAIPKTPLATEKSRSVLPVTLPFSEAVTASAISNMLLAALLQQKWTIAGEMMGKDLFHQPYRYELVPDLMNMKEYVSENHAFGVYLSGAGPTIMLCCVPGNCDRLAEELRLKYGKFEIRHLQIVNKGSGVIKTQKR